MRRTGLNIVLLASLLVTVALAAAMRRDPSEPNLAFMREMVDSIPYDSFARNPIFPNGRTLQPPVPGTIARGERPLHYEATPEAALRAGEELTNPYAAGLSSNENAEDLRAKVAEGQVGKPAPPNEDLRAKVAEGAEAYRIFCLPCHGPSGRGDGPVAMRGFPPPLSLTAEKAIQMKDGQMFHVITYGQGNMPSYASQISRDDRWKIILHVRSLQIVDEPVPARPVEAEASASGGGVQK